MEGGVLISFSKAIQPDRNGPIYHIHCYQMMEKKEMKKEEASAPSTKNDNSYEGFTFEY